MKLGLGLPHLGHLADPDAIRTVAVAAEAAGLDSLWAMDRLLSPVAPRTLGYPGRSDGTLPAAQQTVLDPLVALTVAATVTERIAIGTDVLVAPWYPPVLLARSLAAIDQVSGGRLLVGLGLGWSVDEFEAVGAPDGRPRPADSRRSSTSWPRCGPTTPSSSRPAANASPPASWAPSRSDRPPILLGAHSAAGLDRIACRADGWLPFGIPLDDIAVRWADVLDAAERCGRDPGELRLIVRADPAIGRRLRRIGTARRSPAASTRSSATSTAFATSAPPRSSSTSTPPPAPATSSSTLYSPSAPGAAPALAA